MSKKGKMKTRIIERVCAQKGGMTDHLADTVDDINRQLSIKSRVLMILNHNQGEQAHHVSTFE